MTFKLYNQTTTGILVKMCVNSSLPRQENYYLILGKIQIQIDDYFSNIKEAPLRRFKHV